MEDNKKFELNDDELEKVVGGANVGDRVKVDTRMIQYCPNCGKLASVFYGKVVGKEYYEKGGYYFLQIKSDCCGYVSPAVDAVCTVE